MKGLTVDEAVEIFCKEAQVDLESRTGTIIFRDSQGKDERVSIKELTKNGSNYGVMVLVSNNGTVDSIAYVGSHPTVERMPKMYGEFREIHRKITKWTVGLNLYHAHKQNGIYRRGENIPLPFLNRKPETGLFANAVTELRISLDRGFFYVPRAMEIARRQYSSLQQPAKRATKMLR